MRDDFPEKVKRVLASRVASRCSRPECRAITSGPQQDPLRAVNVGVAAHITAASPDGPRFDAFLTPEQRACSDNGIWLCQTCAKLVDNDPVRYTAEMLRAWKTKAEAETLLLIGKPKPQVGNREPADTESEALIKHNLEMKRCLKEHLLRTSAPPASARPCRPYDKFDYHEVIVRSLADTTYPEADDSPGISGWFKAELWDFYFNGLEVILGIVPGIVDAAGHWSLFQCGRQFDPVCYREIQMWQLGRIPYRNIAQCDPDGDEYYPFPHLFCRFDDGGTPYEDVVYRVISDGLDWPLDPENRFELTDADESGYNDTVV